MRQRATHITLKCCYSEHKWAVIKDRRERLGECAPCTVLAVFPPCSALTSCGLSGACEVGVYCYFMGVSRRTGCEAFASRSCSTLPAQGAAPSGATERPRGFEPSGEVSDRTGDGARPRCSARAERPGKQLSLKCVDCFANKNFFFCPPLTV